VQVRAVPIRGARVGEASPAKAGGRHTLFVANRA
jgi:hypothetical protein